MFCNLIDIIPNYFKVDETRNIITDSTGPSPLSLKNVKNSIPLLEKKVALSIHTQGPFNLPLLK